MELIETKVCGESKEMSRFDKRASGQVPWSMSSNPLR